VYLAFGGLTQQEIALNAWYEPGAVSASAPVLARLRAELADETVG
jgi:hypothetical protein